MTIATTLTADGDSPQFTSSSDFQVLLTDSFGGGTASVQIWKGESIGYEAITGSEKTAAGNIVVECLGLNRYKVNLTGSTTPSLNVFIDSKTLVEYPQ